MIYWTVTIGTVGTVTTINFVCRNFYKYSGKINFVLFLNTFGVMIKCIIECIIYIGNKSYALGENIGKEINITMLATSFTVGMQKCLKFEDYNRAYDNRDMWYIDKIGDYNILYLLRLGL